MLPTWTSRTCHACGERGVWAEGVTSTDERRGSDYFHCSMCGEHFRADTNATRSVMHVQ